ncbi:MAG: hypothetical protein ABIP94_01655, partial [Planctomycetota bacterium]
MAPGNQYLMQVSNDPNPPADTHIQPRTNQCLSAAWAMSRRSGDNFLHVLDQRGAYWQVGHDGVVKLWECDFGAKDARGWDDLGNRNMNGDPIPISRGAFATTLDNLILAHPLYSVVDAVESKPWCPVDVFEVLYEATPPFYKHDNLGRYALGTRVFEGFAVHQWGGTVLDTSNANSDTREAWFWSARGDGWGNLVEGQRYNSQPLGTWPVLGTWASAGWPASVSGPPADPIGNLTPFHDLRSFTTATTILTQQALRAVVLPSGQTAMVLGCPGGRVRVVQPGLMRTGDGGSGDTHGLGSVEETPFDLGYGGSALAVRLETNGSLTIWFGTLYGPTKRPSAYGSATGILANDELAVGAVYRFTWAPGSTPNGFSPAPT